MNQVEPLHGDVRTTKCVGAAGVCHADPVSEAPPAQSTEAGDADPGRVRGEPRPGSRVAAPERGQRRSRDRAAILSVEKKLVNYACSGGKAAAVESRPCRTGPPACRLPPRSSPPTSAHSRAGAELLDAGARMFHVDVMDGHFVPVITFGPKMLAAIADDVHDARRLADVHLMVEQPERHLEQFAEAGADSITVHVEACPHLHYSLQRIHELGCRAGRHAQPGARRSRPSRRPPRYADVLLCMSVNPGWGGQAFIPASLERLPRAARVRRPPRRRRGRGRRRRPRPRRSPACSRAGANILVAGLRDLRRAVSRREYRELVERVRGRRRAPAWTTRRRRRGHLDRALELAERGRRDGSAEPAGGLRASCATARCVGEGWHVRPGGDHAEVAALTAAGDAARRHRLRQPRAVLPPRPHAARAPTR